MTKLISLTDGQVTRLLWLIEEEVKCVKIGARDETKRRAYLEELSEIFSQLTFGMPSPLDVKKMENEIHMLKNQVQKLKLQLAEKERR